MRRQKDQKLESECAAVEIKAGLDLFVLSEEDAIDIFFEELQERSFVRCLSCEGTKVTRHAGERDITCLDCNTMEWFTAGTFFHQTKRFKPWLLFFALADAGIVVSASAFSRIAGIAQSTAWRMYKKVGRAVLERMPKDAGTVSTAELLSIFSKRSRVTPAREHPSSEEDEIERHRTPTADLNLSPHEQLIFDCFGDQTLSCDDLHELTRLSTPDLNTSLIMLELKGLVESLPGDRWKRSRSARPVAQPTPTDGLCEDFTDFVRGNFHGISRKYVQIYLATFWRHRHKSRWGAGALLQACLDFGKVETEDILEYDSPPLVTVMERAKTDYLPRPDASFILEAMASHKTSTSAEVLK